MAASVHIPSRIIVDPKSLKQRHGCIDDALSRAVGRALEKSRRQVLAPRTGYVGVRLHSPEFRWSGSALDEIAHEQRVALEDQVREAIWRSRDRPSAAHSRQPGQRGRDRGHVGARLRSL
jgi:hypothetical protein